MAQWAPAPGAGWSRRVPGGVPAADPPFLGTRNHAAGTGDPGGNALVVKERWR